MEKLRESLAGTAKRLMVLTPVLGAVALFDSYQTSQLDEFLEQWKIIMIQELEIVMDSFNPCTSDQNIRLDADKEWVVENFEKIQLQAKASGLYLEDFNKIPHIIDETQIFCPKYDYVDSTWANTLGRTMKMNDETNGQIAIYPITFNIYPCQTKATLVHEMAHVSSGWLHASNTSRYDDPAYVLGDSALIICTEEDVESSIQE